MLQVQYISTNKFSYRDKVPLHKPEAYRIQKKSPITWRTLTITGIVGSIFLGYMLYLKNEKEKHILRERKRSLGKAQIGGSFELMDCEGNVKKSEDFLGQWLLIYFGFTHCPDVCPDEIEKMVGVVDKLGNYNNNFGLVNLFYKYSFYPINCDYKYDNDYIS